MKKKLTFAAAALGALLLAGGDELLASEVQDPQASLPAQTETQSEQPENLTQNPQAEEMPAEDEENPDPSGESDCRESPDPKQEETPELPALQDPDASAENENREETPETPENPESEDAPDPADADKADGTADDAAKDVSDAPEENNQNMAGAFISMGEDLPTDFSAADCFLLESMNSEGRQNAALASQVQSLLNQRKQIGFVYTISGPISRKASEEANRFYHLIEQFIGKGLPLLQNSDASHSVGSVWMRDFLDAFFSISRVQGRQLENGQPTDWIDESQLAPYGKVRLETENGLSLSAEDWAAAAAPVQAQGKDLYRFYNPNSGEHFYTQNPAEKDALIRYGWNFEGLGWTAPDTGLPVYRLYNPNAGDHHYTLSAAERDHLVSVGWNYEGIGWLSSDEDQKPVYRAYNPNAIVGAHHFTQNYQEILNLVRYGWKDEGIAWYGLLPLLDPYYAPSKNYMRGEYGYDAKGLKLAGVQKVGSSFYYFSPDKNGAVEKTQGVQKAADGSTIWIGENGVLQSGLQSDGVIRRWFSALDGRMVTNRWLLLDGSMLQGKTDFAWFNENGILASRTKEYQMESRFQERGDDGISWLRDAVTGVSMRMIDYMLREFGNARLQTFMAEASKYEGDPYVWAGKSPQTGFDCSGLMTWCMKTAWKIPVDPWYTSASGIYSGWCKPVSSDAVQAGDLVFWRGTYGSYPQAITHTGIYMGNGWVYAAGDPIGFYRLQDTQRPDGSIAPWLFGRV